ncbi:MAG: hypothetical protein ACP5VP_12245 [Candidatus Limnocylindrales bacterium]
MPDDGERAGESDAAVKEQPKGDRFSIHEKCTLLIRVILGEDGQPLFTEADLPALMDQGATVIDRLFDIAARMSGIDVGEGRPSYLQTLFPDKLIRALVDRGDSDAEILAAIDSDELKWWFDRLVSSPAECRALLAELRPQPSSREGSRRPPGRPGWTDEDFWARYQEAQLRAKPPYTYRAIAPHFETLDGTLGTDPEYLRKLVRRHGRPPE